MVSGTGRVALVSVPGAPVPMPREVSLTTVGPDDLPNGPTGIARHLAGLGVDVVVFAGGLSLDVVLATARDLQQTSPEIDTVLVHQATPSLLGDAMRAGIRQVLTPDTATPLVPETVSRMAAAAALRRSRLAGQTRSETASGRLVAVVAAKGGVGRTTIAVNLAVHLARGATNDVVLADLDLVAGDVDLILGLNPRSTMATVATPGAPLDPTVVKLSLTPHPSGLLVLASPDNLIEADAIDPARVGEVLCVLKESFRLVVVDTAPGAGAPMVAAAELADELLVVATPDLGGLRSLRRILDGLDALGLDSARRHLVLNRADLRTGLSSQAIEHTLDLPISFAIPECREIPVAANQSLPLIDAYPKSEAVRVVNDMAAALARVAATKGAPARGRTGS